MNASAAVRLGLAVLVLVFLFVANIWRTNELQLPQQPTGWVLVGVPPVISQIAYGHPHNYTTISVVKNVFEESLRNGMARDVAIASAMSLDPSSLDRSRELLGADDKGIVDFVWLSFRLFGFNVEGFVWTYFTLVGLSMGLFVIRFWREPWAFLIVGAFLAAHVAFLPVVPINPQLRGLLISRVLSVLSMLAFLHLLLEVIWTWRSGFRWRTLPPGLMQVGLIIFVLHITARTGWQVLGTTLLVPLVVAGMLTVGRRWLTRAGLLTCSSPTGWWMLVALWPVVALWTGQAGLDAYKHRVYAPEYFQGETASHVFWHSIFMGLSAHPDLAQELDLRVSDVAVIAATGRYLNASGRHDEWVEMGGESPRFRDIRWGLHDAAVRDMLVAVCQHEPVQCLSAFSLYKPLYTAEYLAWFFRLKPDIPAPHMLSDGLRDQYAEMTRLMDFDGKRYDVWRPDLLVAVCVLGALLAAAIVRVWRELLVLIVVGMAAATLPSLVAYPIAHTVNDLLVMFGVTFYMLIGMGVACAVHRWERRAG